MHVRDEPLQGLPIGSRQWSFRGGRKQRRTLLLLIAAVHLLILLWLITRPGEHRLMPPAPVSIGLTDDRGAKPQSVPPKTQVVPPVVKLPPTVAIVEPAPADVPATGTASSSTDAGAGSIGEQCPIVSAIQTAIQSDPAAMAELTGLQAPLRTEANAVLLWDGNWLDGPVSPPLPITPGAGSTPLRDAIVRALATLAPACSETSVTGPVFLSVAEPARTTTLVIGSGQWQWSALIAQSEPCGNSGVNCAPVPTPLVHN